MSRRSMRWGLIGPGVDQASWVILPPYPVGWEEGSYVLRPKSISFGVHSTNADCTGGGAPMADRASAARWRREDQSLVGFRAL